MACGIAPCNVDAARVFELCNPKFVTSMAGAIWTGLDPQEIRLACDALELRLSVDLLSSLKVMASEACNALNQRTSA